MEIKIPFNDWSKARLNAGRKNVTSRNKRYGNVGDYFTVVIQVNNENVKVLQYELTHVERVTLGFVRDHFYWQEGCQVEDMFVDVWNEIHPRKKFDDDHKVWLHYFREKKHP